MTKSAMIRARIEPGLKNKAEALLKKLGLNATEAITLLYHQILLQGGLPFEVSLSRKAKASPVSKVATDALVKQARSMTPDERLEAFFDHSYLLGQLKPVSPKRR